MNPKQITLIYSVQKGREGDLVQYSLSSPNQDSQHRGIIRRGNEDYNAVLLFLNSRPNQKFDLSINGELSPEKMESLDEIIAMHNAAVIKREIV